MASAYVAKTVEHALVGKYAVGDNKVFDNPGIDEAAGLRRGLCGGRPENPCSCNGCYASKDIAPGMTCTFQIAADALAAVAEP